jgi:hypothetical protein
MERRKALALASAATLVLGSSIVAVVSTTGISILGFGGGGSGHRAAALETAPEGKPGVVVRSRDVYDRYVVTVGPTNSGPVGSGPGAPGGNGSADFTTTTLTVPTTNVTTPSTTATTQPGSPTTTTVTPTTVAPNPTTTIPTTTPTTWPRGVPRDWPKDKPIPPMPPNCRDPQLEDNGVWNCDH